MSSAEVIDQTTEIRDELIKTQEDLIRQLKELNEEGDRKFKEIETELDSALAQGKISQAEYDRRIQEAKDNVADEGGQKIKALEERLNKVKENDPKYDVNLDAAVAEAQKANADGIVLERWRDNSREERSAPMILSDAGLDDDFSDDTDEIVLGKPGYLTPKFAQSAAPQPESQKSDYQAENKSQALDDNSPAVVVQKLPVLGMG